MKAAKLFGSMSRTIIHHASYKCVSVKICYELKFLIFKTCKNNSIAECRSCLEKRLVGTERFLERAPGPQSSCYHSLKTSLKQKVWWNRTDIAIYWMCCQKRQQKKMLQKSSTHQRQPDIPYYGGNLGGLRMDKASM